MTAIPPALPHTPAAAVECPPTVEVNTRKLFEILTTHWKNDLHARASSDPSAVMNNRAFQMTIDLGKNILPLIFREYERENDVWAIALHAILGVCPVPEEHYGRMKLIQQDWLAWGKANGYL